MPRIKYKDLNPNIQHPNNEHIRVVVTGRDKETGRFRDIFGAKVKSTDTLVDLLFTLSLVGEHIHKIRIRRHDQTKIIIGLDVQVKPEFDASILVNMLKPSTSQLDKLFSALKTYTDQVNYIEHIRFCHQAGRSLLHTPFDEKRLKALPEHMRQDYIV